MNDLGTDWKQLYLRQAENIKVAEAQIVALEAALRSTTKDYHAAQHNLRNLKHTTWRHVEACEASVCRFNRRVLEGTQ